MAMIRTRWTTEVLAAALLLPSAAALAEDDARAHKLIEEAFNRRYHWPERLAGFSADFSLTREGRTVKGTLRADVNKARGGVTVECDDADAKKLVSDTVGSAVTHTRASSFEKAFGSCSFAVAGDSAQGGTKISITGHAFFKDFIVKDANLIENHGGQGDMSSEVRVQQVVWLAENGKTIPRAYAFTIKNGDRVQSGKNVESWRDVDGVWVPIRWHLERTEASAAPVESMLSLENIKVTMAK
jgi:hypothetical protein